MEKIFMTKPQELFLAELERLLYEKKLIEISSYYVYLELKSKYGIEYDDTQIEFIVHLGLINRRYNNYSVMVSITDYGYEYNSNKIEIPKFVLVDNNKLIGFSKSMYGDNDFSEVYILIKK